ncbi:aspartyl protease family protein [Qipengyuania sediminis]|uniref:aspartyl protease family protein n=1 Tax=Qipengyuania sediminis TaxID=1532023 RepID=UPI00105AAF0D|nr:aspartyl protease family protein [Qipengyuania sediminis]
MSPVLPLQRSAAFFAAMLGATMPLSAVASGAPTAPPVRVGPEEARMPPLRPAEIDDTLAIGGEEIGGRKIASRMTVGVRVNGTGPYRFVVDSGADTSVVGERLASALALEPGRRVILNSITDTQLVDRVKVDELELGPTRVHDLELPVLRDRDLGAEGMLGLDALVEQRLMLDFENRVITVDEGRTPVPRGNDVIVVTARLRRGQLILTQVSADRQRLEAVVDTGSEITIGNSLLRERLLRRGLGAESEIEVTGVTGTVAKMQLLQVKELKIGGIMLQNVPIAFADIPPFAVFGLNEGPALLIGTDLMETFRKISLDFRNRKVRFQLRKCQAFGLMLRTTTRHATRLSTDTPAACARKPQPFLRGELVP